MLYYNISLLHYKMDFCLPINRRHKKKKNANTITSHRQSFLLQSFASGKYLYRTKIIYIQKKNIFTRFKGFQ